MPEVICIRCNHTTNTAISRHLDSPEGQADGCYARIKTNEKIWEKGCLYKEANCYEKQYVETLCQEDKP